MSDRPLDPGLRPGAALLAILTVAFLLRLGVAVAWAPPLEADAADYHGLATRLAQGEGYVTSGGRPTSWRPPGYPAFLAAVYRVAGPSPGTVRVVQAGLGTATVAATWAVGSLAAGPGVGLVAAALTAADPAHVAATSRLLSEGLFTFLLLVATACLLLVANPVATSGEGGDAAARRDAPPTGSAAPSPGRTVGFPGSVGGAVAWAAAAGALLGAGVLTRGALLGYPFLAAVVLAAAPWSAPASRRLAGARAVGRSSTGSGRVASHLGPAAVLLATSILVLVPWAVRNHRVHDAQVPVATQMGATFYAAQNPVGGYVMGVLPDDEVTRAAASLPEVEASRFLLREGVEDLLAEPRRIPRLQLLKLLYFWVPLDWEVMPWYGAMNPVYAFVLAWSAVAAVLWWRGPGRPPPWPVWLPVLYFVALALVFYGSPRFRMPVEPLLAVAAGAGLVGVARRRGSRSAWRWAVATGSLLLVLAAAAGPLKAAARSVLVSVGLWGGGGA